MKAVLARQAAWQRFITFSRQARMRGRKMSMKAIRQYVPSRAVPTISMDVVMAL